jgi:hypothetical protein
MVAQRSLTGDSLYLKIVAEQTGINQLASISLKRHPRLSADLLAFPCASQRELSVALALSIDVE